MERDLPSVYAAQEPQSGVPARAFGQPRDGIRAQPSSTEFSALGCVAEPSDALTAQVDTTAVLVLSFIVVVIAVVAARTIMLHF
jgi:hypothetical protein